MAKSRTLRDFVGAVKLCGTFFLDMRRHKKPWSEAEGGRAGRRGESYQLSFAANIEMEPCLECHTKVSTWEFVQAIEARTSKSEPFETLYTRGSAAPCFKSIGAITTKKR